MTYHLSHTDLDGYGAQLVAAMAVPGPIEFYNSGYGKRIDQALDQIFSKIRSIDDLLITDLNLTEEQAKLVDDMAKEKGFAIVLLDHHGSGKPSAEKYPWYFLDTSRCGTKITYDWFVSKGVELSELEYIVDLINIYDLWQEQDPLFTKAKALNQVLWDNKGQYPRILGTAENEFLFHLLLKFGQALSVGLPILEVENMTYQFKRSFFDPESQSDGPLFIEQIRSMLPIIEHADIAISVDIDGKIGIVYFGLESIFQEFSNIILHQEQFDFAVNIGAQGNLSLRSRNGTRVDQIAKKYFRGNGHPAASGGTLFEKNEKPEKLTVDSAFEKFLVKVFDLNNKSVEEIQEIMDSYRL